MQIFHRAGILSEIKHIKKFMGDDEIIIFLNTPHSLISDKTDVHTDQVNIFHRYPCNMIYLIILSHLL